MEIQKRCKYCGGSFIAHKMTTIYCSPSCNNKDYKRAIRQKQIAEYMEEEKQKTPKVDSRPLKSAYLRDISQKQYLADIFNKRQKSPHGSFEVVCGGS